MFAESDRLGLTPGEQRAEIVARAQAADRSLRIGAMPQMPAANERRLRRPIPQSRHLDPSEQA